MAAGLFSGLVVRKTFSGARDTVVLVAVYFILLKLTLVVALARCFRALRHRCWQFYLLADCTWRACSWRNCAACN